MSKNTSFLESQYAYWTRTGLSVCFPYTSIPAYASLPLFPCLFYMRTWTLSLSVLLVGLIWFMSKKGYTLTWVSYRLKGKVVGNRYTARPKTYLRRFSMRDWDETPY